MVNPKKHLGQHFLTDKTIAARIVELLPEHPDQNVLEIGPGTGVLTDLLLKREDHHFRAIDVDSESIVYLRNRYPEHTASIIEADFLRWPAEEFDVDQLAIIGNFPYNISSQIFFKVLEQRAAVDRVVCMIQKEVADRLVAGPGSKTYGILSVLLQAYYELQLHFTVKPGSFHPPPRVTSAVISLKRNSITNLDCDEKLFFRVVKTTFNQRRKTIRNSLRTILLTLGDESPLLQKRPEQLSVNQFVELTNWVNERISGNDT